MSSEEDVGALRHTDSDTDMVCDFCGGQAWSLLGGEHMYKCSEIAEYGDRMKGLVATMEGEADELAARRPHRDAHLYDIEMGLRQRAEEIDQWLQEEYYA